MHGHIRQRGENGRWWAVIEDRNPKTGDRVRRWVRLDDCHTRDEAQVECNKLVESFDDKPGLRTFLVKVIGHKKPFATFMARTLLQLYRLLEDSGYPATDCEALELRDGEGFYLDSAGDVHTRHCWTGGKWTPVDNRWVRSAAHRERIAKLEKEAANMAKILKGLRGNLHDKPSRYRRCSGEDVITVEEA